MPGPHVTSTGFGDLGTRDAYGVALREVGRLFPDVYVLTADCTGSVRARLFAEEFPERTINFGIAEANMMGAAAGLALEGKVPFVTGFAMLMSMRACEQVRTDIAYPNLNVKIVGTHGGLSIGDGGSTHHAYEDIAILRSMANMTVIVPADGPETAKATHAIAEMMGPTYMRLGRDLEVTVCDFDYEFQVGRALHMREGGDVTLMACGSVVCVAMEAAALLAEQGVSARVINMHTIKPIDREAIVAAALETAGIVTVEEHSIFGGLGAAVCEAVCAECPTHVRRIGIPDVYAGTGSTEQLREKLGITPVAVAGAAESILCGV
jgi:transketolase